jgi:BolA family transcriptional regulator, general stress-responsive regulator
MSLQHLIESRLREQFSPTALLVADESAAHYGHAGSQGGGQHFAVTMNAAAFAGLNPVKRHQLVYTALQDLMREQHALDNPELGYIHALKLQLRS